jgi:hypothetical protein
MVSELSGREDAQAVARGLFDICRIVNCGLCGAGTARASDLARDGIGVATYGRV